LIEPLKLPPRSHGEIRLVSVAMPERPLTIATYAAGASLAAAALVATIVLQSRFSRANVC